MGDTKSKKMNEIITVTVALGMTVAANFQHIVQVLNLRKRPSGMTGAVVEMAEEIDGPVVVIDPKSDAQALGG